ncbi:MAG: hypothetical protein JWN12_478 [Candidatus Saccharibacteria bacterium]|nr:hypothetical protein [Candidatus Saccharibacteria bacterium]
MLARNGCCLHNYWQSPQIARAPGNGVDPDWGEAMNDTKPTDDSVVVEEDLYPAVTAITNLFTLHNHQREVVAQLVNLSEEVLAYRQNVGDEVVEMVIELLDSLPNMVDNAHHVRRVALRRTLSRKLVDIDWDND